MKRTILTFLVTLLLTCAAYPQAGEELKLYLGKEEILPTNNPTRIAIGNPEVADVTDVSKNEITLMPKTVGRTTLVFWDNFGEQSYFIRVFTENISEIKRRIDHLLAKLELPAVSTQAEEEEGKVLLLGSIKTSQEREKIAMVLGPLKDKTIDLLNLKPEEAGIEIDVQVLEIEQGASKTLGFTWPNTISLTELGSKGLVSSKWSELFKVSNLKRGAAFNWTLDALITEGKARVLSRPKLVCQSGKEAELAVSGEKPIFTTTVASSTGSSGTTVEYKEAGIKLKIKPTIDEGNRIKINLNVEISEFGTVESIGTSETAKTASAYPITKRSVATELFLDDGQTMAIGGLIKQKKDETITRVPFLSDIPIIGAVFRKKAATSGGGGSARENTELFITLTPTIVARTVLAKPGEQASLPAPVEHQIDEGLSEPVRNYISLIQKRITDNLNYPVSAKDAGFQGTVKLKLRLNYLGELLDVEIKSSSGYRILDDNAVMVARKTVPYPPFPAAIDQKELWVDIPIVYRFDT